jgi:glyoxylase-like metal-dependent hydrolase (beta-lactamase superfamily II)
MKIHTIALGIVRQKVALVILTHAHWDHIGSARALVELTGGGNGASILSRAGGWAGRRPGVSIPRCAEPAPTGHRATGNPGRRLQSAKEPSYSRGAYPR